MNAVYHRSYEEREPIEMRISHGELVVLSFPGPDRSIRLADLQCRIAEKQHSLMKCMFRDVTIGWREIVSNRPSAGGFAYANPAAMEGLPCSRIRPFCMQMDVVMVSPRKWV